MDPKPSAPIQFGRYQLIEKLAVGGMAEIFKAKSYGVHGFEKTLVIKRILPHLAEDSEFVSMFIGEAKVMTELNHPKVVQVLDFGEEEGCYYIAMEYVQGIDCLALLRYCAHLRCRPTTGIAVHIAAEVLDALEYAHKLTNEDGHPLGIMHRDISPSNIFISELGEVKLGDFGIAISMKGRGSSKNLKGKYGYMAPEAVSGGEVDQRAEVFSVGIVLAELLMIRRLFIAKRELEVLFQVRDAKIDRLDKYGKHIQDELRQVLESALARDPANRYQDAGTFRDALHRYLFDNRLMVRNNDIRRFLNRLKEKSKAGSIQEASKQVPLTPPQTEISRSSESPLTLVPFQELMTEDSFPSPEAEKRTTPSPTNMTPSPTNITNQAAMLEMLKKPEKEIGLPGITEYRGQPRERIEIQQYEDNMGECKANLNSINKEYLARKNKKPTHVGRKRKITLGPPPKPKPVPSVRPETGEEPRLETIDALDAVPEVDGSNTGYDFRTHETRETVLPKPEKIVTPLEAKKVAKSCVSIDRSTDILPTPDQKGRLEDQSLVKIMFRTAVEEKTGLLVLRKNEVVKEVYLVDGDPQFVTSNMPNELFGQYLVEKRALTEGELSMALAMLPQFDGKLGDTLVALKLLRPMQVLRHLTHQVRQKLLNAFSWEVGTYTYYRDKLYQHEAAPLGLDAFEVIGSGVMDLPDDIVSKRLGEYMDQRLHSVSPTPVPPEIFRLGGQARLVYDKLFGHITLREMLERYDDDEQKVFFARVVYLLVETGMATS